MTSVEAGLVRDWVLDEETLDLLCTTWDIKTLGNLSFDKNYVKGK